MAAAVRASMSALVSGASITVDPSTLTYVSGDVLVLFAFGYEAIGAPSGSDLAWTERLDHVTAITRNHKIWTAVADAAITSFTVANGIADQIGFVLVAVSGADTASPVDGVGGDGNTFDFVASPRSPSISPAGTDSLLLCGAVVYPTSDEASSFTPPAGMTELEDLEAWDSYSVAALALSASGPTGTKDFTESPAHTDSGTAWVASSIAIKSGSGEPQPVLVPHLDGQLRPFNMSTGRR